MSLASPPRAGTDATARDAAAVQAAVRAAADAAEPLRIVGRGTWLDAGRPVRAARTLSVAALSGIVEYEPGDFTLTARAGTTLAEIERATAPHRQFLGLDPFGSPDGTLGATVATGSAGPLAHAFGLPRDNVLGLELVTGRGDVLRTGGRVVKNVAGFDLTRLFTGSWGTLGVITEVTVRLRARPAAEETHALAVRDERAETLGDVLRALRAAPLEPLAVELLNGALAARLGLPAQAHVLVRLGGNAQAVRAQRDLLATLGPTDAVPAGVWDALRACEPAGATVERLSSRPSDLAALWNTLRLAAASTPGAMLHATVSRGVVRCILPESPQPTGDYALERGLSAGGLVLERGGRSAEHGPFALRIDSRADATREAAGRLRLMRRVKDTYDPMHVLNPGLLGEGIA